MDVICIWQWDIEQESPPCFQFAIRSDDAMANRYYLNELQSPRIGNCVFISHQKKDKDVAKKIADYISNAGIDIYFDEYDGSINRDDPNSVVNAIKSGIKRSTHLLCILSQNALESKWIPWEIGYGYDRLNVAGLTVKELSKSLLPEYLQIVPVLRGTKSLNSYISDAAGRIEDSLIREQRIFSASMMNHPLDSVLDWQL